MHDGNVLILRGDEVASILAGQELPLVETVRRAYEAHARGESSLPHSTFLHFPDEPQNRIIALPAYLGGEFGVAGMKWIASFPGNIGRGMDRASAVVVLNSPRTGRPEAFIEGSIISAKRTAASAALAARSLKPDGPVRSVGIVGCGLINREVARFLLAVFPEIEGFVAYDLEAGRAEQFGRACERMREGVSVRVAGRLEEALDGSPVVSIATTAGTPYISDVSACAQDAAILHVSLRDLTPEVILSCDNVVDDVDHVCRARTSLHLTEQLVGRRDFIRCTLADVTTGAAPARVAGGGRVVFSPFGLGVLDLAVSRLVLEAAVERNLGTNVETFLPARDWQER